MRTKSIFSFVILFFLLTIQTAFAQWQQTALNTGNMTSFISKGDTIFASKVGGIYYSTNGGLSWITTSASGSVMDMKTDGVTIFSGTQNLWLFSSTDNGVNWLSVGGPSALGITSIGVSGNNILAGTSSGLFLTSNNGTSWIMPENTGTNPPVIEVNGNTVYIGSFGSSVYRSTNNGLNFTSAYLASSAVYSLAINGNTIYAGTAQNGVYVSHDNGSNWSATGLTTNSIFSLAVTGNNVFAGTSASGIYYSNNGGANWTQINSGLTNLRIEALHITGNYIYAGTYGAGVWKRGLSELIGINTISSEVPGEYSLFQNYPNPFNPTTNIKFSLPVNGYTTLNIYDAGGRLMRTLVNSDLKPGTYEAGFDGSGYASGIYFYTLSSGEYTKTNKMILVK